jgi:dGTPase
LIDCVDEIAYDTADLDDALEAGLLDVQALNNDVAFFGRTYAEVEKEHPEARGTLKFNEALKRVLDFLVSDLIESTQQRVRNAEVQVTEDVRSAPGRLAGFSNEASEVKTALKRFLFSRIYSHPAITEDRDRSVRSLEELFQHYTSRPGSMPAAYEDAANQASRAIVVCDYIAGMTVQFVLRQHQEQFGSADL